MELIVIMVATSILSILILLDLAVDIDLMFALSCLHIAEIWIYNHKCTTVAIDILPYMPSQNVHTGYSN